MFYSHYSWVTRLSEMFSYCPRPVNIYQGVHEIIYSMTSTCGSQCKVGLADNSISGLTSSSLSLLKHRQAARFLQPSPSYVRVWFDLIFIISAKQTFKSTAKLTTYRDYGYRLSSPAGNLGVLLKRNKFFFASFSQTQSHLRHGRHYKKSLRPRRSLTFNGFENVRKVLTRR